jgi:putrescine---pyruvate transaminase
VINEVFEATYRDGVMVRVSGNTIILSPSLVITPRDVSKIVSAIDVGLNAV